MFCSTKTKYFLLSFKIYFMQKTEQTLNNAKIKTFPEKKFPFLNLKSKIFLQSSDCPKLYSWLLLQLLLLNEVTLHCVDECFTHNQEEDLALLRAKYTHLVHWVKWTSGHGIWFFFFQVKQQERGCWHGILEQLAFRKEVWVGVDEK